MSRILECTPAEHLFFTQHLFLSLLGEHLFSASRAEDDCNNMAASGARDERSKEDE